MTKKCQRRKEVAPAGHLETREPRRETGRTRVSRTPPGPRDGTRLGGFLNNGASFLRKGPSTPAHLRRAPQMRSLGWSKEKLGEDGSSRPAVTHSRSPSRRSSAGSLRCWRKELDAAAAAAALPKFAPERIETDFWSPSISEERAFFRIS